MRYIELEREADKLDIEGDCYYVQYMTADFNNKMSKGILAHQNENFNLKQKLTEKYPEYLNEWPNGRGDCILLDHVLNLLVKEKSHYKLTLSCITAALNKMKEICKEREIEKVAFPRPTALIDERINWYDVRDRIFRVFEKEEMDIIVYHIIGEDDAQEQNK